MHVLAMSGEEVFVVDEEVESVRSSLKDPWPSSEKDETERGHCARSAVQDVLEKDLHTIEVQDEEEGVCPVCLEGFTQGDPDVETVCGCE